MLDKLTPELRAELLARVSTAHLDQVAAARDESITLMEAVEGRPVQLVERTAVADWLRLGLLDTLLRWVTGRAKTCIHMPDHRNPEPAWSAAWKPGLVVCTACLQLLNVVGVTAKVCDLCGHVCAGVEADDPIHSVTVWSGALAYIAGACTNCSPELNPKVMP